MAKGDGETLGWMMLALLCAALVLEDGWTVGGGRSVA